MRADLEILQQVEAAFAELARETIFVHSDIQHGFAVERPEPFSREAFLATHFEAIRYVTGSAALWFPTFHYDYCESRVFDPTSDKSQVGHLSEFVRTEVAQWRTSVPVFSVAGTGKAPNLATDPIDPFGEGSIFDVLKQRKGLIFNYGCVLDTVTFIHHCESMADELVYRYPKQFDGQIEGDDTSPSPISVRFHVRPLGKEMTYDWERLEQDLRDEGILRSYGPAHRRFQILPTDSLASYWIERINEEPLYFLSPTTRAWVEPKLDELGRAFTLEDFESTEVSNHG